MHYADFVHLHNHTQYSLLDGANKVKDIVKVAQKFNMPALALTDHGNMFGAIEFYQEARKQGVKPLLGCEVYVAEESRFDRSSARGQNRTYHLVLLYRKAGRDDDARGEFQRVKGFDPKVADQITREYQVDESEAHADTRAFINTLLERGLLRLSNQPLPSRAESAPGKGG